MLHCTLSTTVFNNHCSQLVTFNNHCSIIVDNDQQAFFINYCQLMSNNIVTTLVLCQHRTTIDRTILINIVNSTSVVKPWYQHCSGVVQRSTLHQPDQFFSHVVCTPKLFVLTNICLVTTKQLVWWWKLNIVHVTNFLKKYRSWKDRDKINMSPFLLFSIFVLIWAELKRPFRLTILLD